MQKDIGFSNSRPWQSYKKFCVHIIIVYIVEITCLRTIPFVFSANKEHMFPFPRSSLDV